EGHLQRLSDPPIKQRIDVFIAHLRRRQVQGRPDTQRGPDFPGHGVKAEAGDAGGMTASLEIEGLAMPGDQVAEGAVLDHHALWLACGAGGVDHVSQMCGVEPGHLRV
ncbi:hypothetical protein ALQ98_04457, partial [Pseudomonas syringae pv. lapsa]